ncbi:Quinol monooxygenase YgiN [Rhizobiales bacterium GAS188]|nr:Quinol monooxygenase YgiN [Rhizobiales bacterium GAS188]
MVAKMLSRRLLLLAAAMFIAGWRRIVAQTSGKPIVRMAELEIDSAQLDSYKALLTEEIETSVRIEPGVLMLNAVSVKGSPSQIRMLEVYADQAAYESHLQTPHFLKYKTQTADMVRSLNLVETDPIILCAKRQRASGTGC